MDRNPTVEVGGRSLEDTKREVRKALEGKARGEEELYNELCDMFHHDRDRYLSPVAGEPEDCLKPQELVVYVVALTSCAPLLKKSCLALIKNILQCSWLGRDQTFVRAYCQFLASLISAQGSSVYEPVLGMMVDKFKETRQEKVPGFAEVDRETAQERLHLGLEYILRLVPAARPIICDLLSQKFPWVDETKVLSARPTDEMA